ncbi:MAG: undecaprenyl-diphosphate phosphatase [Chitinophagaceae bacterium]|nr:undecaprenyl-diphosphate phosphatase [Chitinophagaceae bacterium]
MTLFEAIIIAIVEGITEFLPISSTGHMIITEKLLGVESDPFTRLFIVGIQLGAILSVVVLYYKRLMKPLQNGNWAFYAKLLVAVIPALAFGYFYSEKIDQLLDSALTVSVSMIAGGIFLLFIDKIFREEKIQNEEQISYTNALVIGLWQCVAMIPGVSRSAASIIGGMQQKLSRKLAAEFSFFLAIPTMAAATAHKFSETFHTLEYGQMKLFLVGNAVAFIVAVLAIRFFITFLQEHGFRVFGLYRIVAGVILLLLVILGIIN